MPFGGYFAQITIKREKMATIETISNVIEIKAESETEKIALSLLANPRIVQAIPEKETGIRKQFVSELISKVQGEFQKRHQVVLTIYIHLGDNANRMPQRLIYALVMLISRDPLRSFLSQQYLNELNKAFKDYCLDSTHESTRTTEKTIGISRKSSISAEQVAKAGLKMDFTIAAPYVEVSQVATTGTSQENSDYQKQVSQEKEISRQIKDEVDAANSLVNLVGKLKSESVAFYYDWYQNLKREFTYIFEKRSASQKIGQTVVKAQNFGILSKTQFAFSFLLKAFREFWQSKSKLKILFFAVIGLLNPNNILGIKTFKTLYVVDGVNIRDDEALNRLLSQFKILFGSENCMFVVLAPESVLARLPQ